MGKLNPMLWVCSMLDHHGFLGMEILFVFFMYNNHVVTLSLYI